MQNVIFYEIFKEEEAALKKILPKNIHARFFSRTIQEVKDKHPPASIISIRTQSRIPLSWASRLKGILTRSQGFDHLVAFRKACGQDIPCGYLGEYCSRAVAEHAILVMLALLRKLKTQIKQFNQFERDNIAGFECQGCKALVVGVGNIGKEIVKIARGLSMDVRGVDVVKRLENLSYISLSKGLAWADVVFCSPELNSKTRGMLSYDILKQIKRGAFFINISRGEISPSRDLARLLKEGRLGGLGLDVFEEEGLIAEDLRGQGERLGKNTQLILGLKDRENVIFTPHNAFNTQEALERKAVLTAESIKVFLKTGRFPWPVFK